MRFTRLLILSAALIGPATAIGSTIDVGTSGNADCTFWCTERLQQVYASSSFTGGPVLIDSVNFFAAPDNGGNTWNGISTWQMTLSTSVNPSGSLSTTFANNVGGDVMLFDTETFTGTQNVNDLVTFDGAGSFYYDPGNGDLLVDIIRTAGPGFGVGSDAGSGNGGSIDRVFSFSGSSTTTADAAGPSGYGIRTRFVTLPVPEPGTALLVALGLAALGFRRTP